MSYTTGFVWFHQVFRECPFTGPGPNPGFHLAFCLYVFAKIKLQEEILTPSYSFELRAEVIPIPQPAHFQLSWPFIFQFHASSDLMHTRASQLLFGAVLLQGQCIKSLSVPSSILGTLSLPATFSDGTINPAPLTFGQKPIITVFWATACSG